MKVTAIVPSLNPDEKFLEVINNLITAGFTNIIIVNDGSNPDRIHYFNTAAQNKNCTVLTHNKNLGKGRALKTAFNYYLNNNTDNIGVVTIDGDNQHQIADVLKCVKALEKNPNSLILGVRNFNSKNIPIRSKTGNKITAFAFSHLCGISISDTQTGLRAISNSFVRQILDLPGERFDYETNMLLESKKRHVEIKEVPIKAVYIDGNSSSHFNPLKDSISIYMVIGKFIWSSIVSMLCDFTLFILLKWIFSYLPLNISLLIATVGARIVSSTVNFTINKKVVFYNNQGIHFTGFKYYSLCIVQMLLSYAFVLMLSSYLHFNAVVAKIIVDFLLFLISFKLQLTWVFKQD